MSHPDEGLIHAWLDGELDAAESARIEALVRSDPAWAAAAAEARGFIAATSRIVSALDDVPANVIPAAQPSATAGEADVIPLAARRRGTPWWALRAAAVLVVVAGTVVVMRNGPTSVSPGGEKVVADAKDVPSPAPSVAPAPAPAGAGASAATAAPEAKASALADARADLAGRAQESTNDAARPRRLTAESAKKEKERDAGKTLAERSAVASEVTSGAAVAGAGAAVPLTSAVVPPVAAAPPAAAQATAPSPARSALGAMNRAADQLSVRTATVEQCFRPLTASGGDAPEPLLRVRRTSDSTAIQLAQPGDVRTETRFRSAPAPALRVRGDTLFLGPAGEGERRAVRITCPLP